MRETLGDVMQEQAVTVEQLQLVIRVLLLLWPIQPKGTRAAAASGAETSAAGAARGAETAACTAAAASGAASAANGAASASHCSDCDILASAEVLPHFSKASCASNLLLLASLLQQASAKVKQQLMQQQDGMLLLQLLYHVLQDDWDLMAEQPLKMQTDVDGMFERFASPDTPICLQEAYDKGASSLVPVRLLELVLMVLQSLVFVADSERIDEVSKLHAGLGLEFSVGKCFRVARCHARHWCAGEVGHMVCCCRALTKALWCPGQSL
jgi:hypothetical protein